MQALKTKDGGLLPAVSRSGCSAVVLVVVLSVLLGTLLGCLILALILVLVPAILLVVILRHAENTSFPAIEYRRSLTAEVRFIHDSQIKND